MKKTIRIFDQVDPLNDELLTLDVPHGTKILSKEKYTKELFDRYMTTMEDYVYVEPVDGSVTNARIISITNDIANIEINSKHTSYINLSKEDKDHIKYLQVGNEVSVKLNKREGIDNCFVASFSDAVKETKYTELLESIGKHVAYRAKVKELIHGGYLLTIDGISVFMPGSLAGMNKLWDFESVVGKELIVMAINFEKDAIVVSHRAYLKTLVPQAIEDVRTNKEEITGHVTGASKYGIFVEFNECLTGLIPVIELDEVWSKQFLTNSIKPGTPIKFFVKDIISEYKIILTQNKNNPWDGIEEKIVPQMKITGKMASILKYGAFIEIEKGIIGLLHSSEFDINEYKEGDSIDIVVTRIDKENKKINLIKYKEE